MAGAAARLGDDARDRQAIEHDGLRGQNFRRHQDDRLFALQLLALSSSVSRLMMRLITSRMSAMRSRRYSSEMRAKRDVYSSRARWRAPSRRRRERGSRS